MCLCVLQIHAQNEGSPLYGYVYDDKGEPVVGAVIRVEGTKKVALTNSEGRFCFEGKWNKGTKLNVSSIGFESQVVTFTNGKLSIHLKDVCAQVQEVVVKARTNVNAIDVRGLTGQVGTVNIQRLESKPMIDFGLALQGQVAGLVVTNSGDLGSDPKIRIRGNSSLRGGNSINEPLYVLDGQVITSEAFYNLNPQDIRISRY